MSREIVYQHIRNAEKERVRKAQYVAWKVKFDAHMEGTELMFKAFWPESYNKEHWK